MAAGTYLSRMGARSTITRSSPPRGSSRQERESWRSTYEDAPYDELPWFDPGPSTSVRLAVAERFLLSGTDVLDIGCGAGSNVLFLAQSGLHAHGVDLAPGAISAARDRAADAHLDVDVQQGDALALPFPDGSLDALVDNGCFHTLPIPRRGDYAAEAHRVLRPDGRFVLTWIAREHTTDWGPPHRPSLQEVTTVFESRFLFSRTGFRPGVEKKAPAAYFAFLVRRSGPYPVRR
ncbi:MAG: methyltransferase domain-containing protein [Thermoplasmata archaeon]|nr:methyltransferase domain-containing protein [Thermoplasmata archaeon]